MATTTYTLDATSNYAIGDRVPVWESYSDTGHGRRRHWINTGRSGDADIEFIEWNPETEWLTAYGIRPSGYGADGRYASFIGWGTVTDLRHAERFDDEKYEFYTVLDRVVVTLD